PLNLCDFGLFAEQSITTSNRPAAGAAIGANGDLTIGTDASPGTIMVKGNLTINSLNGASVDTPGGVWVEGNVTVQAGASTNYNGNWNVGGEIYLASGNTVNGDVWAGANGGQDINGQATAQINGDATVGGVRHPNVGVSGTVTEGSTHAPPVVDIPSTIPTRSVSCPGTLGNVTINNTATNLPPGDYGDVVLQNNATLVLDGEGTYTFQSINGGGATAGGIQVGTADYTGVGWDVSICGNFSLGNNLKVRDHSGALLADPAELVVYVDGANVTFGTDVYF